MSESIVPHIVRETLAVGELQRTLRAFAAEREWEQFHSPKNLVMALSGEVGELTEIFQWMTEDASRTAMDDPRVARAVRHELADVLLHVLRIADLLSVDLDAAARAKLERNADNYPVEKARGKASKYDAL